MKFTQTTWHNIRRSPYQAFAAISIMTLTFLVISFFTFLIVGSTKIITFFESVPQINAFFKNEAKQQDINNLQKSLESSGKVAKVKFISNQEAFQIYKQQNKEDDPLLMEIVTPDILPRSFQISPVNINDLSSIFDMLKTSPIIERIVFQKDIVQRLTSWTNALRKIGISLIIVLSLFSIYIMMIVIGIKISQKRDDIDIMKLIGATNWYIRWPFIFEGMFYGVIGAVIGWTISSLTLWVASPTLSSFLQGIPVLPVSPIFLLELLGMEILLAILLGAFSSFLAVLRYLK